MSQNIDYTGLRVSRLACAVVKVVPSLPYVDFKQLPLDLGKVVPSENLSGRGYINRRLHCHASEAACLRTQEHL